MRGGGDIEDNLIQVVPKDLGAVFADIGAHEPQADASRVFTKFGDIHRTFEKEGQRLIGEVRPVLGDLGTYLNKAIPDTQLTIKKYADVKFEYLVSVIVSMSRPCNLTIVSMSRQSYHRLDVSII